VVNVGSSRVKARNATRVSTIKNLQTAVEMYYDSVGSYPSTNGLTYFSYGVENSTCWGGGLVKAVYIPGVVPDYISQLPQDPNPTTCGTGYIYRSNGTDYKIQAHNPEGDCMNPAYASMRDPARTGGGVYAPGYPPDFCWSWAVYSPGGKDY